MRKQITISLILSICLAGQWAVAQQTQFSQFYSSSLFLNPAYAGATNGLSLSANVRIQPMSSSVSNEIQQISVQTPIYKGSASEDRLLGVGLTLFNEAMGAGRSLRNIGAMLAVSKPISFDLFGPESLVVGVQAGMIRTSLDLASLRWPGQFNPFEPQGFDPSIITTSSTQFEDQITYPVINAGVLYQFNPEKDYLLYSTSFFSGFAVSNINQPNNSFTTDMTSKKQMQIRYHGGFEYVINGRYHVSPNLLVAYQGGAVQTNFGGYVSVDFKADKIQSFDDNLRLVGGVWYRLRDSFIFIVGMSKERYRVGFSYDLNKSFIGSTERNQTLQPAFEISVNYLIKARAGSGRFSNPLF